MNSLIKILTVFILAGMLWLIARKVQQEPSSLAQQKGDTTVSLEAAHSAETFFRRQPNPMYRHS